MSLSEEEGGEGGTEGKSERGEVRYSERNEGTGRKGKRQDQLDMFKHIIIFPLRFWLSIKGVRPTTRLTINKHDEMKV